MPKPQARNQQGREPIPTYGDSNEFHCGAGQVTNENDEASICPPGLEGNVRLRAGAPAPDPGKS